MRFDKICKKNEYFIVFFSSSQTANKWAEDFTRRNQFTDQNDQSSIWLSQYLKPSAIQNMESAWSVAQSASQPMLASEYLERFDSGQLFEGNAPFGAISDAWLEEFLAKHNVNGENNLEMDGQDSFGAYDQAWNESIIGQQGGQLFDAYTFNFVIFVFF